MTTWLRTFIQSQNEQVDIETIDVPVPALPPTLDGFRLAVVSDLHIAHLTRYHDALLSAVASTLPGCILLGGDTIDEKTAAVEPLGSFFARLASIAPVVGVLGNNDCQPGRIDLLRAMYLASGVTLLENETRLLAADGAAVSITGLTDRRSIRLGLHRERETPDPRHVPLPDALAPEVEHADGAAYRPPSILLMHRPHHAIAYASMRPSLIVAGHAHGGQFRLPLLGGLYSPGQGIFPKWTSGLYSVSDTWMLVSRGLGNHDFPLRLNNRPHLPVAVLRTGERV